MNNLLIKQLEQNKTPVQKFAKKLKRNAWKFKMAAVLTGIVLALGVSWYLFKGVSGWYEEHKVTFPKPVEITLRYPVKIESRIRLPIKDSKTLRIDIQEQISASLQRSVMVERIYQITRYLESEIGFNQDLTSTHIYCESIGKLNQISYFPEGNRKFCFKDEKDQRDTFTKWFNKRLNLKMTYAEIICLYQTGLRQPQCRRSIDLGL